MSELKGQSQRRATQVAILVYVALVAAALLVVVRRTPHPTTPLSNGVRARASSYHAFGNHHPMFAIDGESSRHRLQKWVSAPGDTEPWIEVLFERPRDFSRVRIVHAGHAEKDEFTAQSYRLQCTNQGVGVDETAVGSNDRPIAEHNLDCRGVDTLRVEFDVEPGTPNDVARVYEIEVLP